MLPSIAYTGIETAEFQESEEIPDRRKRMASPAQKPAPGSGVELVTPAGRWIFREV